jgi:cytochrome c553
MSCHSNNSYKKVETKPVLYKPSEMALLMRTMYEYNNMVKQQIVSKKVLIPMPEEFTKIHSAVLTPKFERNHEFDSLSNAFITYQKALYSSRSDSSSYFFNHSINTCVACHQTRCTGPIPKIKALLIQ